jgi:hypothetical protein
LRLAILQSKKALNTYEDIIVQVVNGCFQTLKNKQTLIENSQDLGS